jgi:membrane protein DedA with SNARE-associated domain
MTPADILHILILFGYPLIFVTTIFEGPLVTVLGSFLASLGYFNVFIIYAVVVIADLVGDVSWYFVGYFGRNNFIERYGHYIGITTERITKMERHFSAHAGKTIFLAKITHAIGLPFIIAAGIARIRFKTFFSYSLWATLPKSLIFVLLGYYAGTSYLKINTVLRDFTVAVILLVIAFGVLYYLHNKYLSKYEE